MFRLGRNVLFCGIVYQNAHCSIYPTVSQLVLSLGNDHLFLAGGLANLVGIFITGSAGKFISELTESRIFIFNRNKFLKKPKKGRKKRGGGVIRRVL